MTRSRTTWLMGITWLALAGGGMNTARAEAAGVPGVIQLDAQSATIHGGTARFMVLEGLGNICFWTDARDWISWQVPVVKAGEYLVLLKYSCEDGSQGSTFEVALDGQTLEGRIAEGTSTWYDHEVMTLGRLQAAQAGPRTLWLKPRQKPGQAVMNLAWIRLVPAEAWPEYQRRAAGSNPGVARAGYTGPVFIVPNFHPASCGWLTDFSTERNYCAYSYLDHLDRLRNDPQYAFAFSEINNLMAIMEFEPGRMAEFQRRVAEGRLELVNAFFLEPTINLSGGEALVKMGVEGLRWYQQVMGTQPRFAWMIDVTGVHEQMGQVVAGLGLEALVYTRDNPTTNSLHWMESPDGTRVLSVSPGHYSDWGALFNARTNLGGAALKRLAQDVQTKARRTPSGLPVLVLGGGGDYALAPANKAYPTAFLEQWKNVAPTVEPRFTGLGKYIDAVLPKIRTGEVKLPVARSGAKLSWTSFWIQNPKVKAWYRRDEHSLQAAEAVATVASMKSGYAYPVQPLYHAWLQMLLNMDRNTLWGAAGGMVFEHPRSWDARDRFEAVAAIASETQGTALRSLLGKGESLGVFNPLNWARRDPALLCLPAGLAPSGAVWQPAGDGTIWCQQALPALGATTLETKAGAEMGIPPVAPGVETIETTHYVARIDPVCGALRSVKLKPSGREILDGPVLLVAERGKDGHDTPPRPKRPRLGDSTHGPAQISVRPGPVATVVEVQSTFYGGGALRQKLVFYRDYPRIDFDVELNDLPNQTVVVAEFPLAHGIREIRRGIPYGFSHGAWEQPNPDLAGWAEGIQAAIRWSHYQFTDGGGVALLDRGLPGRELNGRTPVLFLLNAQDTYLGYPCAWLSGKGKQQASFALVAHDGQWEQARVPQLAWEFNCPPILAPGTAASPARSYLQTSENVIVEALRREGGFIEARLVECLGRAGTASVKLDLPHQQACLTNLRGERPVPLLPGPDGYLLPVRPQQILTLRFATGWAEPEIQPLVKWDELVPPSKLEALKLRLQNRKGHPPMGSN